MKIFGRIIKWTLLTCLVAPALVFLFLCFNTVELPGAWVEKLCSSLSQDGVAIRAKRVLFRLTRGVRIESLRVSSGGEAFAKAARIDVEMDLFRMPWNWRRIVREVTIRDLDIPRLPQIEDTGEEPPEIALPDMRSFRLKLVKANILGINVRSAEAERVKISHDGVDVEDIRISWPDADTPMKVSGEFSFALPDKTIRASVRGQARQHNIRPLLEVLDVQSSFEYMDAFTGIIEPIDAAYHIEANLETAAVSMIVDLHPTGGAYRRIPLKDAQGRLDIAFKPDGRGDFDTRLHVGPISAHMADGTALSGALQIDCTNNAITLAFEDVRSSLALTNALTVSEVLTPDMFDFLRCDVPPEVKLSGKMDIARGDVQTCALSGEASLKKGSVFGVALANAQCGLEIAPDKVAATRIRSETLNGGTVAGGAIANFDGRFHVDIQAAGVPLEDIADAFDMDIGDRSGKIDASFVLEGKSGEAFAKSLNGSGKIKCEHGHLAQLNLFSGFTDYLVERVPGVANLVQQSHGGLDFTIQNGVFKTNNLLIEGDIFSIRAEGGYDIAADRLDFRVHVNLFRNDTFLSRLASPISWTFNKLLLEFKLTGPLDGPVWQNASIIGGKL